MFDYSPLEHSSATSQRILVVKGPSLSMPRAGLILEQGQLVEILAVFDE